MTDVARRLLQRRRRGRLLRQVLPHGRGDAGPPRGRPRCELPVFCAQNGIRNEEMAARYFRAVHGVMVLIGAKRLVPGEVVHTSAGPLGVGRWPSGLSEVAREVTQAVAKTDIPAYTTEEIAVHKWNKMAINLNNATFGLLGISGQEAQADPEVRAFLADVYEEGVRVLRAAGIRFEGPRARLDRGPDPDLRGPATGVPCPPRRSRGTGLRSGRTSITAAARSRPTGSTARSSGSAGARRAHAVQRAPAGAHHRDGARRAAPGPLHGARPARAPGADRRLARGATEPAPREARRRPDLRRARCSRSSGRRSSSSSARWRASTS